MNELTDLCLDTAVSLGASYADIRIVNSKNESLMVKNGRVEEISSSSNAGFGVRLIANGSWGFASSFMIEPAEIRRVTRLAYQIALASSAVKKEDLVLSDEEPVVDSYKTNIIIDPWTVPLEKKLELLMEAEKQLRIDERIRLAQASMDIYRSSQLFASSEGSRIEQEITHCGAGMSATAVADGEIQRRSYPNSHRGQFTSQGFEAIESMELAENSERVAQEALQLLSAKDCPSGKMTVVLDASQLALQLHESVGHPSELDRVLGMEASFAGTSFLDLDKLDKLKLGSPIVNITADATIEGGLGSFGYDDEGVKAQRTPLVREGRFVGYLTSRETAPVIRQKSNGTMRADGWNRIPLIRMTNVNLEPGDMSFEQIISEIRDGIYLETNKSWSIDDKRLNFQFATEIGWEIKDGKRGAMLKNCNYTGITPEFWNSCDAISNRDHWSIWGVPNCGKGEPMQIAHVAHGTSPARFRNVQVGVGK
jgi:TldD protein